MMEMQTYHCQDPAENPVPAWLVRRKEAEPKPQESDPVARFKQDPDAFFPDFISQKGGR